MDANVDKDAKGGDIGHDSRKLHTRLYIFYLFNPLCKSGSLELLAGIAAGLGEQRTFQISCHGINKREGRAKWLCPLVLILLPL